jgi:hypothetical protein
VVGHDGAHLVDGLLGVLRGREGDDEGGREADGGDPDEKLHIPLL